MKKLCLPLIAAWAFFSFNNPTGFQIKGNIPGGRDGIKVYLKYADIPESGDKSQDSTTLQNGQFIFTGRLPSLRYYKVLFKEAGQQDALKHKSVSLFVENAEISLEAPYDSLSTELDVLIGKRTSRSVLIKGSSSQLMLTGYNQGAQPIREQYRMTFMQYAALLGPGKDSGYLSRQKRMALCDSMDLTDSISKERLLTYITATPPDEVTAFIALKGLDMGNINTRDIDILMKPFIHAKQKGAITNRLLEQGPLKKKTVLGSSLVNMSITDTSGRQHALSDYIGKGRYVLLECWASWCHPCRADIPHLKEVYDLYHPHGFEIISVSLDTDKSRWLKAIGEEKMKWLQLSDLKGFKGDLPSMYRINGIPACLLFDPQGKLVTRNLRGGWMDKRLISMYGNYFAGQ